MSQPIRPSQEVLIDDDESSCSQYSTPSTQEIITAQTQEASSASDFFDLLTASQVSTGSAGSQPKSQTASPSSSQSGLSRSQNLDFEAYVLRAYEIASNDQSMVEKKKRGRKKKIRTAEELVEHLREKKEKNRLAAQRLRKKKCQQSFKYDQELVSLEKNVKEKRMFADLIQTKVNKLRTKIEVMITKKPEKEAKANESHSKGKCIELLGLDHDLSDILGLKRN